VTDAERQLLSATAQQVRQLFSERDDLLIGITAVILDLYQTAYTAGADRKRAAVARLRTQHAHLRETVPDTGGVFLQRLIDALEARKLDATRLLGETPVTPPDSTAPARVAQ
jgi:hypothetical protein